MGRMPDYGRPVRFGVFPEPTAAQHGDVVDQVRYADRAGLDVVGIQDHPYQRRHLDTLSLIAYLTAVTTRISFFPDVANLPLRPPAVLGKTAASIDVLGGGRFDLGLGAGAYWDAVAAMGGPHREPRAAVDALEEAIAVLRLMWSGERSVRYEGVHYAVSGLHPGPAPAHPIGIWLGAAGPRMLALTGRVADGWVPSSSWAGPDRLAELQERIDAAAADAGRDPAAIRRIYNVNGVIQAARGGFLAGPVEQWTDELADLALSQGIDTFVLWPTGEPMDQLRRFAEEVAPAVRAAVAGARSS